MVKIKISGKKENEQDIKLTSAKYKKGPTPPVILIVCCPAVNKKTRFHQTGRPGRGLLFLLRGL
jgi:hypothetical protein